MNDQSHELLRAALLLPAAERAEVAVELLASLDGETDSDADAAWNQEIERRARRALDGHSTGADWRLVRDELEQQLSQG
jgi:hypothetical protein